MRIKFIPSILLSSILFSSCGGNTNGVKQTITTNKQNQTNQSSTSYEENWLTLYDKIEPTEIPENPIDLISNDWMLITAGNQKSYNTMTAAWGAFGYVWERPSTTIFVKNTRYTFQFLEKEDSYTFSFFSEDYRGALRIMGTRSGRDTNKVEESGLTPIETPSGLITFKEARMIIECKKMYSDALDYEYYSSDYKEDIINEFYKDGVSKHHIYIGEITNVWIKK